MEKKDRGETSLYIHAIKSHNGIGFGETHDWLEKNKGEKCLHATKLNSLFLVPIVWQCAAADAATLVNNSLQLLFPVSAPSLCTIRSTINALFI